MNNNSSSRINNRRKGAAVLLAAIAARGIGFGAASQLNLSWNGTYQAGSVTVDSNCQATGQDITVGFSDPIFNAAVTLPWTISTIQFADVSDACNTKSYSVAYQSSGSDEWTELVSGQTLNLSNGAFDVDLPSSVDPQEITNVALTIYGN
ncbi:hypothetical protein [Changpingibacter yushuensis]|uniref:hypothetical protein n=1 Tax=Changpingibacter yushuensis TaxID=2758440 RepID=UPI00165DC28E|nr:hypothetical protein [Changpingibacter yushuensis]